MNIVFSIGDYNGIGPEILVKSLFQAMQEGETQYTIVAPLNVIEKALNLTGINLRYEVYNSVSEFKSDCKLCIINMEEVDINPGVVTEQSGIVSYKSLLISKELIRNKKSDALVTMPLTKYGLQLAGAPHLAHTELIASWENGKPMMMFIANEMMATLATIHIPLSKVANSISRELLEQKLQLSRKILINDFGILNPQIAVLGLNPHAGENGLIGVEEKNFITDVIDIIPGVHGPFPADGFFAAKSHLKYDLVFGMYHDQVLIPFKLLYGEKGVNYTAGLTLIRTSPDHGTAFDIAWKGVASHTSVSAALELAKKIVSTRDRKSE